MPIPVLAWIIYLWTRSRPAGFLDMGVRVLISAALAMGAFYGWGLAMFAAFFVG